MLSQSLSRPPAHLDAPFHHHPEARARLERAARTAADMGFADQSAVIEYLNQYPEVILTDAQGRRYLVLGQPLSADPTAGAPFQVFKERRGSTWRVRVQPGSIVEAWNSAVALYPTVRGALNTAATPVYLRPEGGGQILAVRVELSPLAEEVEPGYWEPHGAETVSFWDVDFYAQDDARLMQVNPATGAVLQTGIYYRPLAEVILTGEGTAAEEIHVAQHALGPWTVKVCGGSLVVLPGPMTIVG